MPVDPIHPIRPAARTLPPLEPAEPTRRVTREESREQSPGGGRGRQDAKRRPGRAAADQPTPGELPGSGSRVDIRA